MKNGMTINIAAYSWVAEMNSYPWEMIETLMAAKPEDWCEVTLPCEHNCVYIFGMPEKDIDGNDIEDDSDYGEIIEVKEDDDKVSYIIETDGDTKIELTADEFEVERDGYLPMWGWLWSFSEPADNWWLEEEGIRIMSECGFRIYEHEEWGYFFGIDGYGYNFYEEHWIPLYKARGLHWHDERTEHTEDITEKHEEVLETHGYEDYDHMIIKREV